jgi:Zn-dependent peptidase ImmA (M78 family)
VKIRRKYIRGLVKQLLARFSVSHPPVPVEKLANSLGATVCRTPADDDDLSGFMYHDRHAGTSVIGVNGAHSPNRQRFTIGHELGHLLLHHQDGVHVDRRFQVKMRNKASSAGTDLEELEANLFAAELLMPASLLESDLERIDVVDLEDEAIVAKLATRYKVSTQAMTFRLANLGYLEL